MNLVRSLLSRFRWLLTLALACGAVSAIAGLAVIDAINGMIVDPTPLDIRQIGVLAGLLAVVFACGFASQALLTALGHRVVYDMRLSTIKRVLDTDVEQLEAIGTPSLYATLTKDIASIGMAFNRVPFIFYNAVLVIGGFIYLAWLSWELFLLSAAVVGLGVAFAQVWVLRMRSLMKQVRETDDRIYAGYQDAIEGRYELALNTARKRSFYERDFEPVADFARATEVHADRYWVLSVSWTALLILGLTCAIFIIGELLAIPRERMAAFVLVLMFLRMPLNDLVGTLPILMTGSVALAKIESLRLTAHRQAFPAPQAPSNAAPTPTRGNLLSLESVTYDYPSSGDDQGFHLGPINLEVGAGETLFIVGGNGSGKSTLMKLLSGLYRPSSGVLQLGKIIVTDEQRGWYREHFATAFSNAHLFERLVGPNGLFDIAVAQAFIERLRMEHKVSIHGDKLSTTRLSQGQRKRLTLLAAYVEARPILLLDEWAADQDPLFRDYFYTELLPELKRSGRTIIAVSHDDRYFHVADRVVRCDSGLLQPISPKPKTVPPLNPDAANLGAAQALSEPTRTAS
jgi:putative ATP-binding cassette transporter